MDRENNLKVAESERDDYSVGSGTRKNSVISYIICVIIAFVAWLIIMNVTDSAENKNPLKETDTISVYNQNNE